MSSASCLLDLTLEWRDEKRYYLSGRFLDSQTDTENALLEPVEIGIDADTLGRLPADDDLTLYGKTLTEMLLADEAGIVRRACQRARDAAAVRGAGLRIRLNILTTARELHALRWEAVRDPADASRRLLTQDGVWFSRFFSTQDLALQPIAKGGSLQCLVAIADPSDVSSAWGLGSIDATAEFDRIRTALAAAGDEIIRPLPLEKKATVSNIVAKMRETYADILYLVCHGTFIDNRPRLLLEKEDGTGASVAGEELVEKLRDMTEKPRLVVLASCKSAGSEEGAALAAVGPRLATAGVPSVVAMQGPISIESAQTFMADFFRELACDGQVDRAVAVARSGIQDRPDWWVPVLFTRSRSGRLWPGIAGDGGSFDRWDALVSDIREGQCVPVLGPDLVQSFLGSTRELAKKWAERYEFALAPRDRDDLAQVAQYLRYRESRNTVVTALREHFVSRIRNRFRSTLEEIDRSEGTNLLTREVKPGVLDDLLRRLGKWQRSRVKSDVHRLLAKLPVPVFISANRDDLLYDALVEEGKKPQVHLCTWRVMGDAPQHFGDKIPPGFEPSKEAPLIFQVFGRLRYPQSLVLTEDDYFDFLIAVTRNETLEMAAVPGAVSRALASSGLLLVGFQADDWDFRALFRGIMRQPGSALGQDFTRVAVQFNPAEGQSIDPDRASRYLNSYFQQNQNTSVFWGSPEEFVTKLADYCAKAGLLRLDE